MELCELAQSMEEALVTVRRDLHRIPELANQEFQTQAYILDYLAPLRPDSLMPIAGTGVKAVFYAKSAIETIAFRANMDALQVDEWTNSPYASAHPGLMHASGHDGHMAILLLLCTILSRHRHRLTKNVVLLFQPAEENDGARSMIADGALVNPKPDAIYALQLCPDLKIAQLGLRRGAFMAQASGFDLTIIGKSAHGANPDKGIDAVVAAAELISMLQTLVSRISTPDEPVVLTIGKIHGGEVRNIICDKVVLNGTLRTFSNASYDFVNERIANILSGFELATGVKTQYEEVLRYYSVENPTDITNAFEALMAGGVQPMSHQMIGEDFSFYQQEVPGLFFFIGISEYSGFPPLQSPHFNFNEKALLYGLEAFLRLLGLSDKIQ